MLRSTYSTSLPGNLEAANIVWPTKIKKTVLFFLVLWHLFLSHFLGKSCAHKGLHLPESAALSFPGARSLGWDLSGYLAGFFIICKLSCRKWLNHEIPNAKSKCIYILELWEIFLLWLKAFIIGSRVLGSGFNLVIRKKPMKLTIAMHLFRFWFAGFLMVLKAGPYTQNVSSMTHTWSTPVSGWHF